MSNLTSMQSRVEDLGTRLDNIEKAISNQEKIQQIASASAAIAPGVEQVFVTYAGTTALSLANPVAGTPGIGSSGQDGATLCITDTTGHAHVLTTGANGINGSKHTATWNGTVGSSIILRAFNGSWYIQQGAQAVAAVALA